jgi:hypothetical protein
VSTHYFYKILLRGQQCERIIQWRSDFSKAFNEDFLSGDTVFLLRHMTDRHLQFCFTCRHDVRLSNNDRRPSSRRVSDWRSPCHIESMATKIISLELGEELALLYNELPTAYQRAAAALRTEPSARIFEGPRIRTVLGQDAKAAAIVRRIREIQV